ncbi:MAG: hypothetical protein JWL63_2966 [Rhodocyclales bacterium]|nr:hypothetical protein [Rhodocyclales bacterium]
MTAMFRQNRERLTHRLSSSSYSLTIPGGKRVLPWILLAVAVCVCVAVYVLPGTPSPAMQMRADVGRLQQEVDRLQHEVKFGEMRLQQEVATREGLAQQMDVQAQKLRQAEQELEFFRGQKNMAGRDKVLRK